MRYTSEKRARIEIIPMIDIMLFLLVFFVMMTLKMIPTTGHITKLPTSTTAESLPTPKLLVELSDNGAITVAHDSLSLDDLTTRLKVMGNKTIVTIAGTQGVALQKVMAVLDAVKLAGVSQIAIAASRSQ
jgi:biopolymer transport protein ExbD